MIPPSTAGLPYDDIGVFRLQHLSVHYAHFPTKPSFSLRTRIQSLITAADTAATRRSRRLLSLPPDPVSVPIDGEHTPPFTYDADSDLDEEGEVVSTKTDTAPGVVHTGEQDETENGELDLGDVCVQDFDNRHHNTLLPEPDDPLLGHLDKVKVPNQERKLRPSKRNWLSLMPYLLGVSLITLLRTLAATTFFPGT